MVQRLMLMRETMMKTREQKRQQAYEKRQAAVAREDAKRKAAMDLKKKRSYALKGAMEKRKAK